MHRRQIFGIVFGLKSDTRVLTFTFRFLFFPLFLLFLPHFFSFAGHLVDFILVGKVFRKAFRIFRITTVDHDGKGRWVVEQDFHGSFQVNVTRFFAFFSWPVSLTELCLFWFGWKDVFRSTQVSGQSCPWPLKLMTSQAVEAMWICMGSYGWLRGRWVKMIMNT